MARDLRHAAERCGTVHVLDLCDRVVLLEHGAVAWEGSSADVEEGVVSKVFEHGPSPDA